MKAKEISKALDYLMDACMFIELDCEACGGCPLRSVYCMHEVPMYDFAELSSNTLDEFLEFGYGGEAEAWRWQNMSEYERRENYEAEIANLERSSLNDD